MSLDGVYDVILSIANQHVKTIKHSHWTCGNIWYRGKCGLGREYGALYSTSDMIVFDSVVEQFQRFERENVLKFTYQFTIDMHDLSFRYHPPKVKWNIGQKKVQLVLVNQKWKARAFIKEKWEHERLERMYKQKQNREKNNEI